MAQYQITVPKIASQAGDARLYEVLKDIVRRVSDRSNELDVSITSVAASIVTGTFPFYTSVPTYSPIALTTDRALPFFLASSAPSNIPLAV